MENQNKESTKHGKVNNKIF